MTKPRRRADIAKLEDLPNVGPATARDLRSLGIALPDQLRGQNGYELYNRLCRLTGISYDPCVIDVFLAAVDFMNGAPSRPWWRYTKIRKADMAKNPSLIG
jgi:hypothetical protein